VDRSSGGKFHRPQLASGHPDRIVGLSRDFTDRVGVASVLGVSSLSSLNLSVSWIVI
jgi:hypothetical protein